MKQTPLAVLCVILLAFLVIDAKAQDQGERIKQLEDRIEKLDGDLTRIKEEYNKKLADSLAEIAKFKSDVSSEVANRQNAFEGVYSLAKVPVGTILPFYGDPSKLPSNWKLCEGQKVTDSESPFDNQSLPDLRQRFLKGALNNADLGSKGGQDSVPNHWHRITGTAQNISFSRNSVDSWVETYKVPTGTKWHLDQGDYVHLTFVERAMLTIPFGSNTTPADSHGHMGGTGTISGKSDEDGGHDNRPPFISVHFIIRIR